MKAIRRSLTIASMLLTVTLLFSIPGFSQANSGDITGTVQDATGAVVPNASVTATNEGTGVKANTTTNSGGSYRFGNLPIGTYTLSAGATGFSTATVKSVRVELSNTITVNLTVQIGSTATTVEVSDSAASIDTTTAQVQTTFESREAIDIPSAATGSGVLNLSLLSSGVASSGGVGQGAGPSVAGQRPDNNSFNLDGVSNNSRYNPGPLVYVSNDAIAQVSILQNQFSPEFGGGSGGIFNSVVKSGTNQIHGSIYEYLQNRDLNAVDSTKVVAGLRSNPRYDNNRLGATIGGPILKDKLFYFGNFEYNPIGQAPTPGQPVNAPTAAGYSILAGLPGINKTNLTQLQKYVPAAPTADQDPITVLGKTIPVGSLTFNSPTFSNSYNALISIDYNMSSNDQVRGRYIYNKTSALDTSAQFPIFWAPNPNINNLASISEYHTFSPTFQNELRISYNRNFNSEGAGSQTFPGLDAFPVIALDDLGISIGPSGPTGTIQNLFQAQDNITKQWGKHTIKAGYHFTDVILTNAFIQRVTGNYEYNSLGTYLQDLSPDVLGERSAGPKSYPVGFLEHEFFVNDDYRLRPNLTLNLGVRWEYATAPIAARYQSYSAPASVPGGITFAAPNSSPNNWSPRIGLAWSPGKDGVWSFRAGFSRAFDPTYGNLTSNAAPPYFQQTQDVPSLVDLTPNFLANGGLKGAAVSLPTDTLGARSLVSSYTFGGKLPYGITYTAGVQRLFGKNYTFEARYIGTKGVHLWNQSRLNIQPIVTPNNYIPTYFSLPSASTLAGLNTTLAQVKAFRPSNFLGSLGFTNNIVGYAPQGYSAYNGLAVSFNRRFSNNFSFLTAYTWSHAFDDATATNFSTYLTPRRAQDFQNLRAEWATSALDRRHRFTFTPIYDWKMFRNSNWVLKNVVSNWSISGTYTFQSPEYATVQSNVDSNLNGDTAGDRSIINTAGAFNVGSGVTGYNKTGQAVAPNSGTIVAYVATNPNARFVVAGAGALANAGRNDFPLKRTNNVDAQLLKRYNFTERLRVEFGAQLFNVFNHSQFVGGYLSDIASNGFTASRSDLVPSNALFGRFDQFYSSNSRTMQLVARFVF